MGRMSTRGAADAATRTPPSVTVWLTGLPSAGKSTIAVLVANALRARGRRVEILDGDELRRSLCADLGFSREDRENSVRRVGWVANLLARNGLVVLVAVIAPQPDGHFRLSPDRLGMRL